MTDPFIRYLEDKYPLGSSIPVSEIRNLKRKYDAVAEFSDVDEDELVSAAEKAEMEYRKRQRTITDAPVFSPCNEEELIHEVDQLEKDHEKEYKSYTCETCGKKYTMRKTLNRHMKTHTMTFSCQCGKSFTRQHTLNRHRKVCIREKPYTGTNQEKEKYECKHCGIPFPSYEKLFDHITTNHPLSQMGGNVEVTNVQKEVDKPKKYDGGVKETTNEQDKPQKKFRFKKTPKVRTRRKSALNDSVQVVDIIPQGSEKYDVLQFFANAKQDVKSELENRREQQRNVKWYLNTQVQFKRDLDDGSEEKINTHFRSKTYIALQNEDEEHETNEAFQKMNDSLEEFIHKGSNWLVEGVVSMEICTVPFSPLSASSYMNLPLKIRFTGSVVNVKNNDNKCFLWSILAALHSTDIHPERVSHYEPYENELNMMGIEYPVSLSKIEKFERQNDISINIFGFEEGETFPLYLSKLPNRNREVDLLYISNESNQHYCLIKNLNRFLRSTNKGHKHYYCRRCLHGFIRQDLLDAHRQYCNQFTFQKVKYPEEGKNNVEFRNFHKQIRVPFVIYADFETINKKMELEHMNEGSSTTHLVEFEACGYSYQVVCTNDKYTKPPVVYRGKNAVDGFLEDLLKEETYIRNILSEIEPLIMSEKAESEFQSATNCYICGRQFNEKLIKVRDHAHEGKSGCNSSPQYTNYRGASCQRCNLNLQNPTFIPVVMHNCRGFDSHLIMSGVGKCQKDIQVIPNSMEKYISFQVSKLRFLDSYQFMPSSLEILIDNLAQDGLTHFKQLQRAFPNNDIAKLLLRKNVYCYDYIDDHERFKETRLPPKEAFYNRLKEEHISDTDYEQVVNVWNRLNLKTLGDLHDNYVKTDVVLLADVMERFRDMCMENYSLDCLHYYTSPGLSYDAALKMSGVCLDLITDPMMYNLFELQTRGGISMVTKKFAVANNPYIPETFDDDKPRKYLMYLDANNLYGYAMSQPLPTGYMRLLEDDEIQNFDVQKVSKDGEKGYVLEVDLEYPTSLHDKHNDYPLGPTHKVVSDEELSPYSRRLWTSLHNGKPSKRPKVKKLVSTLSNKENYILHYETLKVYLRLGMEIKKIHKVVEFHQCTWMKTYIDFNAKKRSQAKNDFEKDFYKLMCNR